MKDIVIALDQGTTSTRAIAFDRELNPIATAQRPLTQHYPAPGWVEHDGCEILAATIDLLREVTSAIGGVANVAAIGITNQRETVLGWNRKTGVPIANAIVWQDRRTAEKCDAWRAEGHEENVQAETGLLLDPYFSASKINWLLANVPEAREACLGGDVIFGTIDAYLVHRLTGGEVFATDATNAGRTSLLALKTADWSPQLTSLFDVPPKALPRVQDSVSEFGVLSPDILGAPVPIRAVLGDQHAALLGHGCLEPGAAKITFGTGGFLMANSGRDMRVSKARMLSTLAWRLGGVNTYALEGSIFMAGATVQWLAEGLKALDDPSKSAQMAASVPDTGGVVLVPAFVGLGAPYWDANARGAVLGMTRDTTQAHIVRAGLEAIAHQTADLTDALKADGLVLQNGLKVDGGVARNDWAMQTLADVLGIEVHRPKSLELTARGVALAAQVGAGLRNSVAGAEPKGGDVFRPQIKMELRSDIRARWARAITATRAFQ
jgi:glycerol kinase